MGRRHITRPASRRLPVSTSRPRKADARRAHQAVRRDLTDYRDAAYAARISALIARVRAAETKAGLADALTFTVARAYHKLLAVKDA